MILACEPGCSGFVHAETNAALLAVLREAFPGNRIVFLAERDHLGQVLASLENHSVSGIESHPVRIPWRRGHVIRYLGSLRLCRRVFELAAECGAHWVVFSSVDSHCLMSAKRVLRSFREIRCAVVIHGIAASITARPKGSLRWWFWFRRALEARTSGVVRYVVMGSPIQDALSREIPSIAGEIVSIDHPYFFADPQPYEPLKGGVIRFGAFGVGHRDKGTDLLFRMARELRAPDGACKPQFILVGHIADKRLMKLSPDPVVVPSPVGPMSREDFEAHARAVDYAVFLHRPESYALRASGTLFDAFSHLKPIIAVRTPLFDYYFERMGDIGYLCSDYDEMKGTIIDIMRTRPVDRYMRQRANLLSGRALMSLPRLGARLARGLVPVTGAHADRRLGHAHEPFR